MSIRNSSVGIIYEYKNSKPLKSEKSNININSNKILSEKNVILNKQNEYVFRKQGLNSYFAWPTLEEKFLFDQILKFYELNSNQSVQGFNDKYFNNLSELLNLRDIDTKEYSKKRIQLFNKRINGSHSSFINYFKNRGEDVILQSSMNTKLSPLEISYNAKKLRNAILKLQSNKNHNINKIKKGPKKILISNHYSRKSFSPDLSLLSFNQYRKSLRSAFKKNDSSTARNDSHNSLKTFKKKFLFNNSDFNHKISENNKISNLISPRFYSNNQKDKNINYDEEIKLKEKKAREDFFCNYNKKKYIKFLKYKYKFLEDKNFEKKLPKMTSRDIKRMNIYKFKPSNKFISKEVKDAYKFIFFKKIKNKINELNNSNIRKKPLNRTFVNK